MKLLRNTQTRSDFPDYEPPKLRTSVWQKLSLFSIGTVLTFCGNAFFLVRHYWSGDALPQNTPIPPCSVHGLFTASKSRWVELEPVTFFERRDRMAGALVENQAVGFIAAPGDLFR